MKRGVTNIAASVRQRLLNESKRRGESFDYLAAVYARERFLARLGISPHRNRLILKGASVFALWFDIHRPTRDLDFLGVGHLDESEASRLARDVCNAAIDDDGLRFEADSVEAEAIRDRDQYRGIRLRLQASLDAARIRLQIDIGLGDVVTPAPALATLPVILDDFAPPRVKVYPAETIVAEKLHAIVKLGIANSRMKDFFDLHLLAQREFNRELLASAVIRTFRRRKTPIEEKPFGLTADFYADSAKQAQWRAFLTRSGVDAPADFTAVGAVLRRFLLPVLRHARASRTASSGGSGGAK